MSTGENVERVVAPILVSAGLELVDVEVRPGNLRVVVDRAGGPDLDEISKAASAISRALDNEDVMPGGRYELEVSSPGLERRLRRPEHFSRFVGSRIAVRTSPGTEGERRLEGVLESADTTGIGVAVAGPAGGSRRFEYDELDRVHTIFDWKAALAGTSALTARAERRGTRQAGAPRVPAGRTGPRPAPARTNREMTETG